MFRALKTVAFASTASSALKITAEDSGPDAAGGRALNASAVAFVPGALYAPAAAFVPDAQVSVAWKEYNERYKKCADICRELTTCQELADGMGYNQKMLTPIVMPNFHFSVDKSDKLRFLSNYLEQAVGLLRMLIKNPEVDPDTRRNIAGRTEEKNF